MKLTGKVVGKATVFVNEKQIEKAGSLDEAIKGVHERFKARKELKSKPAKAKASKEPESDNAKK